MPTLLVSPFAGVLVDRWNRKHVMLLSDAGSALASLVILLLFNMGALEIDELERTPDSWAFNVTRCRYAELYRSLGMAELGATLSCNRDAALIEGFDPDVTFERTQTLMEGKEYCDFRYRKNR